MTYPDLDELDDDELRQEIRHRSTILEDLKHDARFSKHSWDRRKATEKMDLARENLRDALNEQGRRDHLRLNRL